MLKIKALKNLFCEILYIYRHHRQPVDTAHAHVEPRPMLDFWDCYKHHWRFYTLIFCSHHRQGLFYRRAAYRTISDNCSFHTDQWKRAHFCRKKVFEFIIQEKKDNVNRSIREHYVQRSIVSVFIEIILFKYEKINKRIKSLTRRDLFSI